MVLRRAAPFLALLALPATAAAGLSESYGRLPLHFEENRGQAHEDVRFLARGPGYGLYLTAGEAVLALGAKNQSVLRMALVGAKPDAQASGLEELPGKANYFIGKDSSKWRTNVPTYAKVRYRGVYPGIDLVYYGNQRQLEYDFVVAPGADAQKILLRFEGADAIKIDTQGDLVLHTANGELRQRKPVVYQDIDGTRHEIEGRYVIKDANRFGFRLAAYDASEPLVIDPVLGYSTYLGGDRAESGSAIAVDIAGNAYVTGGTTSTNFPVTDGAFQSTAGTPHVFVTKLDSSGSGLIYSTYLGGSAALSNGTRHEGHGIAVDATGNAYITGATGAVDFPTTPGAFQLLFGGGSTYPTQGHGSDAFVTKLNPTGSALIYSTYLGGYNDDKGVGIALDAAGSAYVVGDTKCAQTSFEEPTTRCESNFPTSAGAFDTIFTQDSYIAGFVTKLSPSGSDLAYSTYLGTGVSAVALDADGNAYMSSYDVPPTRGAFQVVPGGDRDAGVTKLNAAGSATIYSTLLGGSGVDSGNGIAVDTARSAYLTGTTTSLNFPTTQGAFQRTIGGGDVFQGDAFVTKLDPTGSALVYSTYLGGAGPDQSAGIAVDTAGNAYVAGSTFSMDFPTSAGAFQTSRSDQWDAYVTILDSTGSSLRYSTYLGGSFLDFGYGIAVDPNRNAYVTGGAASVDFPTTVGAYQSTMAGGSGDAFVAKLASDDPQPPGATVTRFEESAATYRGYWPTYGPETGTFSGGAIRASNQATATATFSFTGTAVTWIGVKCNVCGLATVQIDGGAPAVVDTFGPGEPGSLVSEPVFTASGLAPDTTHTLTVVVTGGGAAVPGSLTGSAHVAVDAFDVTK
jgi:hypothetical protein